MIFNYDVSELSNAVANMGTNNVKNNSSVVSGTTLTTVINNLASAISGNSTNITNLSNTVSNLGSSDIRNQSGEVSGTSVTTAINNIASGMRANATAIANLDGSDIANDSQSVSGATVTAAIDSLNSSITTLNSAHYATLDSTNVVSGSITARRFLNVICISGTITMKSGGIGAWLQTIMTLPSTERPAASSDLWGFGTYDGTKQWIKCEVLTDGTVRTRVTSSGTHSITDITFPSSIMLG